MRTEPDWMAKLSPVAAIAPRPGRVAARTRQRQDELLDEALMETFPASDPISFARIA